MTLPIATPHSPLDTLWPLVAAQVKARWGAVTENDLEFLDRTKEALVAKVFERTGLARDTAERQLDELLATIAPLASLEPVPPAALRFPASGNKLGAS